MVRKQLGILVGGLGDQKIGRLVERGSEFWKGSGKRTGLGRYLRYLRGRTHFRKSERATIASNPEKLASFLSRGILILVHISLATSPL